MRLAVLDQSTVVTGRSPAQSIRETLALAKLCELLGYSRYWLAEHHNSEAVAGAAPEVLMGAIAATTARIRVGSAGIMLPHYSALKVAEVFRVLEAIAPGRIDMGLGRAPGSDGLTAHALNPNAATAADHFPAQVRDLLAWVSGAPLVEKHPFRAIVAQPAGPTVPEAWILGSSDYGAQVAAHFGLPYCFAHFITDGQGCADAIGLYREDVPPERTASDAVCLGLRVGAGGGERGGGRVSVHGAGAVAAVAGPGRVRGAPLARGSGGACLDGGRAGAGGAEPGARDHRHRRAGGRDAADAGGRGRRRRGRDPEHRA